MNRTIAILIAIMIGLAAGIQPAMNAKLGKIAGPKSASLLNFLLGGLLLLLFVLVVGDLKEFRLVLKAPWYLWLGSILGLIIITGIIYIVPVIGTGSTLAIIVALQLSVGLLADHFAWFGTPRVPIDWIRIAGLVLLILGVQLITH